MNTKLPPPTEEQWLVIEHPLGVHARVLAVAGSGKTSTMAFRARYLTEHQGVNPSSIQVLMFNKLAAEEFSDRLNRAELAGHLQPRVNTFHSYCFGIISKYEKTGLIPKANLITSEQITVLARKAISRVFPGDPSAHPEGAIEPDEAIAAISLWKGSLIHHSNAGYHGHSLMPQVYREFEHLRMEEKSRTYDDFVPLAVEFLSSSEGTKTLHGFGYQFLIVDEYQDVNYGQQRLIELLAGDAADIMVVGDDDQTIYEWRGARSSYIINEFQQVFSNKPNATYKLSTTFRFGPVLAQAAHNAIAFNTSRVDKPLIAFDHNNTTQIQLHLDRGNSDTDVDHMLCDELEALLASGVVPTQIIALCRMYTQLHGFEVQLSSRRIPYHVLGASPFFERREITRFLAYLRIASYIEAPLNKESKAQFVDIANFPNRFVPRQIIEHCASSVMQYGGTISGALTMAEDDPGLKLSDTQRKRLSELRQLVQDASVRIDDPAKSKAGEVLTWLDAKLGLSRHFDNYYGQGEGSQERKDAISNLVRHASTSEMTVQEFLQFVDDYDSTCKKPPEEQIRLTSIFRTKGLEYDYVFVPGCQEGYMPCTAGSDVRVFDKTGSVRDPTPADAIENERRLFYVAVTRARKAVVIGASAPPVQGNIAQQVRPSRFIEELQLGSVRDLLGALPAVRKGDATSTVRLVEGVKRWGGKSWVRQSFVEGYLAAVGNQDLTGVVATLIARIPEQPFTYKNTYPTPIKRTTKPFTGLKNETAWRKDRPDFGQAKPWGDDTIPF